jgi:hypothetical protein
MEDKPKRVVEIYNPSTKTTTIKPYEIDVACHLYIDEEEELDEHRMIPSGDDFEIWLKNEEEKPPVRVSKNKCPEEIPKTQFIGKSPKTLNQIYDDEEDEIFTGSRGRGFRRGFNRGRVRNPIPTFSTRVVQHLGPQGQFRDKSK